MSKFMAGYDLNMLLRHGVKIPIEIEPRHTIIVGPSGSGKSTALLYLLYKMSSVNNVELTICDFKRSHEFDGITDNLRFGEFEDCYDIIIDFYQEFIDTPEGGNGNTRILIIDEIAGLLSYFSTTKEGKQKADEVRNILSTILMLGRSRKIYLWLSMQRYTATIFPASSGAGDNMQVAIGLGRLSVEGRKGLFAGEHFDGEEDICFGMGKGIVLIEGQPLKGIIIPQVSKTKLLQKLQDMNKQK